MNENRIRKDELFDSLPSEWPEALLPAIQERMRASGRKVVVLDDDPTGTQTVHGVAVLTEWTVERLAEELGADPPAFYLLTNSRSLPLEAARARSAEIGANLREAARQSGRDFVVVSRSDSTLRGHFPGEVQALAESLEAEDGQPFDAWLVAPFFPEGGRFTAGDVHYVAEGEWLTPAGQTEFAQDKAFGYRASNLREWVLEKTGQSLPDEQVASISIEDLRQGGPEQVSSKLLSLPRGAVCVVNAASYRDLEVLVLGLLEAEAQGWRCLYRTAASFVRVRAGIAPRPLLTPADLRLPQNGCGLVVAGSYVPKTTAQIKTLLSETDIAAVEIQVEHLLDEATRPEAIERAQSVVNDHFVSGRDVALYTSRALVSADGAERNLAIGRIISDSLVAIVRGLGIRPRYLLAKGGITASDIATHALDVRRALVLGQILPGVPVWQTGAESRYPGMAYIVFPGNVGDADALSTLVKGLQE